MRKSEFSESQIVAILTEGEPGVPVAEVWRGAGIAKSRGNRRRAVRHAGPRNAEGPATRVTGPLERPET